MFRKIALAALAALTMGTATLTMAAPSAEARPLYLHRGGGGGMGAWHGNWRGNGGNWRGGWGHRGWRGNGDGWGWGAAGLITGLAAAPLLYGPGYGYGYGPGYGYDYYEGPDCGWERVRVRTPYGYRFANRQVCY
jgi:hypothetical protein